MAASLWQLHCGSLNVSSSLWLPYCLSLIVATSLWQPHWGSFTVAASMSQHHFGSLTVSASLWQRHSGSLTLETSMRLLVENASLGHNWAYKAKICIWICLNYLQTLYIEDPKGTILVSVRNQDSDHQFSVQTRPVLLILRIFITTLKRRNNVKIDFSLLPTIFSKN